MTSVREVSAIAKKQLAQRELLWPGTDPWLWHRKANKGFATIPKTMPIILQIMDGLSNGKPLATTYLGLWCSTWDNSMVNVSKPDEMAYAAGFTGQRATYTWQGRINLLKDLKFIDVKPGKSGAISHILLWNPHYIIRWHQGQKTPGLVEANFNALLERALEIGANDMIEPMPDIAAPSPPPPPPSGIPAPLAAAVAAEATA
jgi:hypothetical protein